LNITYGFVLLDVVSVFSTFPDIAFCDIKIKLVSFPSTSQNFKWIVKCLVDSGYLLLARKVSVPTLDQNRM